MSDEEESLINKIRFLLGVTLLCIFVVAFSNKCLSPEPLKADELRLKAHDCLADTRMNFVLRAGKSPEMRLTDTSTWRVNSYKQEGDMVTVNYQFNLNLYRTEMKREILQSKKVESTCIMR